MSKNNTKSSAPAVGAVAPMSISADAERSVARQAAAAITEIQSAIRVALEFPRDEKRAADRLIESCKRASFAEDAEYDYPRGKVEVERPDPKNPGQMIRVWEPNIIKGPSVYLAREAARMWGNIRTGCDVVTDDMHARTIEGWAWDLETNYKVSAQAAFAKLIQRKQKGGGTQWVPPDERDLRELTNKHGAIAVRNCILNIIPSDVIDLAIAEARATMRQIALAKRDETLARLLDAFAKWHITPEMIASMFAVGKLTEITVDHIVRLRAIYASIRDGNSTWSDYMQDVKPTETQNGNKIDERGREVAETDVSAILDDASATESGNRGHDDTLLNALRDSVQKSPQSDDRTTDSASDAERADDVSPSNVASEEHPPMHADVLRLQARVVEHYAERMSREDAYAESQRFLLKATRALISSPSVPIEKGAKARVFRSISPMEALTISDALDAGEIRL